MDDEIAVAQAASQLIQADTPEEKAEVVDHWIGTLLSPFAVLFMQHAVKKGMGDPIVASRMEQCLRFVQNTRRYHGTAGAVAEEHRVMEETIRAGLVFMDAPPRSARQVLEQHRHLLLTHYGINALKVLLQETASRHLQGMETDPVRLRIHALKYKFLHESFVENIAKAERSYLQAIDAL